MLLRLVTSITCMVEILCNGVLLSISSQLQSQLYHVGGLKSSHGGSMYTMEIGKYDISGLSLQDGC